MTAHPPTCVCYSCLPGGAAEHRVRPWAVLPGDREHPETTTGPPHERPVTQAATRLRIPLLGGASAKILAPLLAVYPRALPREEVAATAGYTNLTSKGFANAIGRLRTLGFVDYPDRGSIVAAPVLFLEG